ncbi:hypothetical protein BC827DRAFT_1183656 [Russula dissimulans]|nr:hypothetical protein BC827DRAFT_1183656 [Russula dissimulans]
MSATSLRSLSHSPMDLSTTSPLYRSTNLLHRRGSASASDPFGIHTAQNLSDERVLRSRLTIVRVAPDDVLDHRDGHRLDSLPGSPESHRASWSPTSPSPHHRPGQSRRLSFASSSFAHESLSPVAPNSPPSYASRKRRSSTSIYAQRTSLTPQQICDLAQSSVQPPQPDVIESSLRRSPVHFHAHSSSTSPTTANFHPLPDGQFLPFLDRPTEVSDFISTSPTNRLMALLEQAFPAYLRRQRTHAVSEDPRSPPSSGQIDGPGSHRPTKPSYHDTPPVAWSYDMLLEWMSTVPRSEADDAAWVRAIRACVMAHSEQISVTLLAALGVPMEGGADLDVVSLPIGVPDADSALPDLFTTVLSGPLAQLPTVPEVPSNENEEDAFQLEILPVTFESTDMAMKPDAQQLSRSGSTSSWSPSSQSSLSSAMESIDESDHEQGAGISAESVAFESESPLSDEHLPGEVTVRAGSPMGAAIANFSEQMTVQEPLSTMAEQWDNESGQYTGDDRWRMAWEQVENCQGLVISTCERLAADPSLPSSVSHSAMPHAVASPVRPKQRRNTVPVSHVLSGAPGYEGFTWRPGGPLFPMSFTGATGSGDGLSTDLEKGGNLASFMSSNPVLKPRSRSRSNGPSSRSGSRSKTKVKSPLTPPNSPVAFLL